MSCLSKKHRLNNSKDFNQIYKSGKKWHTASFVAFFTPGEKLQIAFVASKKVGNAVQRARAKRRLRALYLNYENKVQTGKYIIVAKNSAINRDPKELQRDFLFAIKKLQLFKNEKTF
ncbi:ribonuclease P protein component [Halarcobacter anaerophilus]|uniref:ribonuclease P protein component n=1 Tax=Halarcobacter anaerophilus TaxID=877500 RepID=UPI0005C9F695|nr:ribonuclease P protein component [Halarcobacter anaerophilus]